LLRLRLTKRRFQYEKLQKKQQYVDDQREASKGESSKESPLPSLRHPLRIHYDVLCDGFITSRSDDFWNVRVDRQKLEVNELVWREAFKHQSVPAICLNMLSGVAR
jgi:hypothetical protein